MRKTKIICTLGPSTDNEKVLREMMLAGMDVARINFSHQTHEDQKRRIDMVKKLREELGLPIAIVADTKGPEIRTGNFPEPVMLEEGQQFILSTKEVDGSSRGCSISFKDLPSDVERGTRILIDDGLIELKVESKTDSDITCRVINGGRVSSHKGINVPDVHLSMPYISSADRSDLRFAVEQGCDFIAASFVRSASDLMQMREELKRVGGEDLRIIAKIENADGVANIDQILELTDGVMVARGDMGVEIPFEEIPILQKMLIRKGYGAGKQVVTATQMLESMITNPRPTRAETTDVANAIYDGTSAIMLSGETAAGKYPVEAVRTMAMIAERTEKSINYIKRFKNHEDDDSRSVTNAISHATCTTVHDLEGRAIITVTKSGQTARMLSKYRPAVKIISCTTDERVQRQMNLSWGVKPLMIAEKKSTDELFQAAIEATINAKEVDDGDLVVITAGVPVGKSGTTNMLKVHVIGEKYCI